MPQDKTGASLASGAELSNPIFEYVPDLCLNERMLAPCEKNNKIANQQHKEKQVRSLLVRCRNFKKGGEWILLNPWQSKSQEDSRELLNIMSRFQVTQMS